MTRKMEDKRVVQATGPVAEEVKWLEATGDAGLCDSLTVSGCSFPKVSGLV